VRTTSLDGSCPIDERPGEIPNHLAGGAGQPQPPDRLRDARVHRKRRKLCARVLAEEYSSGARVTAGRVRVPLVRGASTWRRMRVALTPEQVVEVVEFETADPALHGKMTISIALADADGGTDVVAVHEGLPPGLRAADNEAGWRSSLAKLAALVEGSRDEGADR
jgi:hypothetical protein